MKYEKNACRGIQKRKKKIVKIFQRIGLLIFKLGLSYFSRFHFCISHRRKMKAIRRSLKTYLEKKLEELMGIKDEKEKDFRGRE